MSESMPLAESLTTKRVTEMERKHPSPDLERQVEKIIGENRRYFWDKGPLSLRRDKYIIIERVLEFGTEEEVEIALAYYGPESVKEVVRESRSLSPKTVNYFERNLKILAFTFLASSVRAWEMESHFSVGSAREGWKPTLK